MQLSKKASFPAAVWLFCELRKAVNGGKMTHDEEVGYNIIRRACRAPLTQIADNAGVDGGVVCEKVSELEGNHGYNAATGTYEDMVKRGVIDPVKVTRSALHQRSQRRDPPADQRCSHR